jgi:hypothetical protein
VVVAGQEMTPLPPEGQVVVQVDILTLQTLVPQAPRDRETMVVMPLMTNKVVVVVVLVLRGAMRLLRLESVEMEGLA